MVPADLPCARNGRTRIDCLEQTPEVGKLPKPFIRVLEHARRAIEPAPRGYVGDRIGV